MAGTEERRDGFVKLCYASFSFVRQSDLAAAPALRMMPGLWLRWSNAIALSLTQQDVDAAEIGEIA
jgi:hypothetical protein